MVSATINRYSYLTCRELPPFFEHKSRFVWSRIELVSDLAEIAHPAIKGVLEFLRWPSPALQLHHDGDLPAMSGMGTSAAFTVGLLHALTGLKGQLLTKRQLAFDAITVDHEYVKDGSGSQDQVASAIGGVNHIKFGPERQLEWEPLPLRPVNGKRLEDWLMLFYTGLARNSGEVEREKHARLADNTSILLEQKALVDSCLQAVMGGDTEMLAKVLSRSWELKKELAPGAVTNSRIDGYYGNAINAGALGGKLLGAGGGGCILLVVPPEARPKVKAALAGLVHIPFQFETQGSQLVYYSPSPIVDVLEGLVL